MAVDCVKIIKDRIKAAEAESVNHAKLSGRQAASKKATLLREILAEVKS